MATKLKQRNIIWHFRKIEKISNKINSKINKELTRNLPNFCSLLDEELWRKDESD